MTQSGLTCRYCRRSLAVPTATCPWPDCGKVIMVICTACKQYTDDQEPSCQHCGASLAEAMPQELQVATGTRMAVAQLTADRARAQLVASGVIAEYTAGFFFRDARQQTILVDFFGFPLTPQRRAAAVLLSAIAYLVQKGYCALEPGTAMTPGYEWSEARQWDGQVHSWEGKLAFQASQSPAIYQVLRQAIAEEMEFRFEVQGVEDKRTHVFEVIARGGPRSGLYTTHVQVSMSTLSDDLSRVRRMAYGWTLVRDRSLRPSVAAVLKLGQEVVLPEHEETNACRQTYQMLLDFVRADPECARYLAHEILMALEWFRQYEKDPRVVFYT